MNDDDIDAAWAEQELLERAATELLTHEMETINEISEGRS